MKRLVILTVAVILSLSTWAGKSYEIQSPDGTIKVTVKAEKNVTYSISKNAKQLILPSGISMQLENGKTFGIGSKLTHAKKESRQGSIRALFYKKQTVEDNYNSLTLQFKEKFNIIFRVYDEGVAYRFVSTGKQEYKVINEQADFNFAQDWKIWNAYVNENGVVRNFLFCLFLSMLLMVSKYLSRRQTTKTIPACTSTMPVAKHH